MNTKLKYIYVFVILSMVAQLIFPINIYAQDEETIVVGDTSISKTTVDSVGENEYKITEFSGYTIIGDTIQPGLYMIKGTLTLYRSMDSFKEFYESKFSNNKEIKTEFKEPLCEVDALNKKIYGVELKEGQVIEVSLNTILTKETDSVYRSGYISIGQAELIQPGKYDLMANKKNQSAYIYKDESDFGSTKNNTSYALKKNKWVKGIHLEEGNEIVLPENTKIRKNKNDREYITCSDNINVGENETLKPGIYDIYQSVNKEQSLQIYNSIEDLNEDNDNKQEVVLKKNKWTKGVNLEEGNVLSSLPSNTRIKVSEDKYVSGKIRVSQSSSLKPGKYDFKSLKNVFSSISVYDSVELFSTDEDYRNYKTFDSILFDKKNKKIRGVVLEEGMIVTVPENTRYKTSKESEFVGSIIVGQNMQLKSGKYDFQAENKDVGVTIYNTVDDYKSSTNSGEYFYLKKGDKNKGIVVEEGQVISCSNIIKIKENNSNYYSGEVLVGDDKKVTPGFYDISSNSKKSKTIYVYENAESEKESKIFYKVTIPTNEKRRICLKEGNVLSLGDNIKLEKSESSINYLTGVIKIGEDIPSGAYNLYSIYKNTSISLYKNQSDFDAENVIENKSIQKKNPLFSYELRDGNYLKIDGCLKYVRVGDVSEEVKDESENTNEQSDSSQEMQQQIQTKTKEQIASELNKKLNAEVATVALEQYGRERYAKFKLHSAFGVIAEEPKDENTWLLKYNVTIVDNYGNKADTVVEAYVTGTSAKPEVTYFYVYP